jgi:hypothetical protein
MRLPHENYIRFLITTGLNSEETNSHLDELGLVGCTPEYWDEQYKLLFEAPLPKVIKKFWENTRKPFPKGFVEYMNVVDLKEAWLYNIGKDKNKAFKIAVDSLSDPDVSVTVKCLVALRTEPDEISALLNGKFGMPFPRESAVIFQKYFFNNKIMLRSDWRKFIAVCEPEEKVLFYKAISGQTEVLRIELGLPTRVSVSEKYQRLHVFAMEKFDTYRNSSDPKADANALKWASMAMQSGDKYEKLKTSDASDFGRDLQMEFEHVSTEFPLIGGDDIDQLQQAKKEGTKKDVAAPIPIQGEFTEDEFDESGQ